MTETPIPTKRGHAAAPTSRPLDALDSQVALIRALSGPDGMDLVNAMNRSSGNVSGTIVPSREMAAKLNHATTLVVTDRMLDVVLDRMRAVPFGDPVVADDLLFESGYVVFPRPIELPTLGEDDFKDVTPVRHVARFDAGFWTPTLTVRTPVLHGFGSETAWGVMYVQSCSIDLIKREFALTDLEVPEADVNATLEMIEQRMREDGDSEELIATIRSIWRLSRMGIKHAPVYSAGMGFGVTWNPDLREKEFVLTPAGEFERRFWLSFWRTLKEEVFAPVRFRRKDTRPAARLGLIPDVVVADLRRVRHRNDEERLPTGEVVMWNHRWIRRGHLRTIHKGTPQERKVPVREHVVGPKNMPLIQRIACGG